MAWEWAGPASGALIGAAGLVTSWRVTSNSRRQEMLLAAKRHDHEVQIAHEQWHRDRRADAYVQLLDLAEETGMWVQTVFPFYQRGERPPTDLPSFERQGKVWARIAAFASPPVCEKVKQWRTIVHRALRAAEDVAQDEDDARRVLDDLRAEEQAAREALSAAIAQDLLRA